MVTANDYEIGLYNGDTGVVVDDGAGGLVAAFGRGGEPILVPLVRLGAVRPLHAMTVHRSQGSQFARITVLLPPAASPLGTRETLYTAVTRAKHARAGDRLGRGAGRGGRPAGGARHRPARAAEWPARLIGDRRPDQPRGSGGARGEDRRAQRSGRTGCHQGSHAAYRGDVGRGDDRAPIPRVT